MPSKERTKKGKMGDLQRLVSLLRANGSDLGHLEATRQRLEAQLAGAMEAADRQAAYTAAKQEASQQCQAFLEEGGRLAHILRLSVKQHYGVRSEKVAEFGLQPFRGRAVKAVAAAPAPPAATAETPNPTN